jgi:hypothetical protein
MGTWATFLLAGAAGGAGLPADAPKHRLLGQRGEWAFYELAKMVPALKLDHFVESWSNQCPDVPLIACSVEDSDLAYLLGAISGSIGMRLVFNPEMVDYLEGEDGPLIQLIEAGEAGVNSQAEESATWSENLPGKVTAAQLKRWLRKDWIFAEEAVRKFLEAAGLQLPEENDETEDRALG